MSNLYILFSLNTSEAEDRFIGFSTSPKDLLEMVINKEIPDSLFTVMKAKPGCILCNRVDYSGLKDCIMNLNIPRDTT